ncbi:MAG: hypothetical protein A2V98_15765 [Planctomycetes bacterium RBG_16_64_12]|nr:MAG: hypothetical protein A2V98_15765 [Planctomycetes bacterium RBG_16_64_12]
MSKKKRWHPSHETDELVFAVCDRFLAQLDAQYNPHSANSHGGRKGAAAATADWVRDKWGRADLTREKIYPLFWEAARRRFLVLQPPRELHLAQRIADTFGVGRAQGDDRTVRVVGAHGSDALQHVSTAGAELVLSLVEEIGRRRQPVHIGLGGGYSAMLVARHLAYRIRSDPDCPSLVLHAMSAGGFQADKPQRSPIGYFNYFDDALTKVEFVALFSHTIASNEDYERIQSSPDVRTAFARADEIDIVITSFSSAQDEHGMLRQFFEHLVTAGALPPDTIRQMLEVGWIGEVQFRPYSAHDPLLDECPVRAVTLFEISDLVRLAQTEDKHVVLLARPCAVCGALKTDALRPLLTSPELRVWTHLVLDVDTASSLLRSPAAVDVPTAAEQSKVGAI